MLSYFWGLLSRLRSKQYLTVISCDPLLYFSKGDNSKSYEYPILIPFSSSIPNKAVAAPPTEYETPPQNFLLYRMLVFRYIWYYFKQ